MEPAAYLDAIERDTRTLLGTARGALDRRVPPCPEWDVADLVAHIGMVWRWAADNVERGAHAEPGEAPTQAERSTPPEDRSEGSLLPWATACAEHLLSVLRATDPDASCWTFGGTGSARFWLRRQALETAMHMWDVGAATGTFLALPSTLAADGLDEFLSVGLPRRLKRDPGTWHGESLHLHRTDGDGDGEGDGEWLVQFGPDGALDVTRSHGKADVALRGPAADLWLWSTNRRTLDECDIEVFGDPAVAKRWSDQVTL